jgi:hypothetical protein
MLTGIRLDVQLRRVLDAADCFNDFSYGYGNSDLNDYKNNGWGTTFEAPYDWLGGDTNGDPGNWAIPNEAWGYTDVQVSTVTFSAEAKDVSFIFRGNGWAVSDIMVKSSLNSVEQESFTVNTSGDYTTWPVTFTKPLDTFTIDTTGATSSYPAPGITPVILDNLAYTGPFDCAVVQN